jgi:hypothetical protein
MNKEVEKFNKEKQEELLSILPKFIKHIFVDYMEKESDKEKFLDLASFCEGFAALLFCVSNTYQDKDLSSNTELEKSDKIKNSLELTKGVTFGFWTNNINYEKVFREEEYQHNIAVFIKEANRIRNEGKGHSGVANEYGKNLKELESVFLKYFEIIVKFFLDFEVFKVLETNVYRDRQIEYKIVEIKNNYLNKKTVFENELNGYNLFKDEYYIKNKKCMPQFVIIDEVREVLFILSKYKINIDLEKKLIEEDIAFKNYSNKNFEDEKLIKKEESKSLIIKNICDDIFKERIEFAINEYLKNKYVLNNVKIYFENKKFYFNYERKFNKSKNKEREREKEKENYFKRMIGNFNKNSNCFDNNIKVGFDETEEKMFVLSSSSIDEESIDINNKKSFKELEEKINVFFKEYKGVYFDMSTEGVKINFENTINEFEEIFEIFEKINKLIEKLSLYFPYF